MAFNAVNAIYAAQECKVINARRVSTIDYLVLNKEKSKVAVPLNIHFGNYYKRKRSSLILVACILNSIGHQ
jgi:hypothetical protein